MINIFNMMFNINLLLVVDVETYYALLMCCISADAECTHILSSHVYTHNYVIVPPVVPYISRMYRLHYELRV